MTNKALVLLFNKIYNDGKLTKLVASKSNIRKLDIFYKENFQLYSDYDSFINELSSLKRTLEVSKAAKAEFAKQFSKQQALQPAILNECFVIQTVANLLELEYFIDADDNRDNVPAHLLTSLIKAKGGELEGQFPRYIYHGSKSGVVLLQYGDSSSIDAIFVNEGFRIRLEIKDSKAKMGEYDLDYKEDGKLIPSEKIKNELPGFLKYIEKFNTVTDVYKMAGSNYKIGNEIDKDTADELVSATYKTKKLDLYLLQDSSKIFALPSTHLLDNIDISGSEIRMAGRNNYTVFTPNNLKLVLSAQGAKVDGDLVSMLYNASNERKGRGMTKITRYDINSLYFLKINDVKISAGYVSFELSKVRQKKPTISMHVYTVLNKSRLASIHKELN
jgi:hypothetical protein